MPDICLTLLCHAELEERVLDTLLLTPQVSIFTSSPASVHGLEQERLGESEQVLGRARGIQVQALLPEEAAHALAQQLARDFAGAPLRYWMTPVIASGACS
jgi:hypothetical protein